MSMENPGWDSDALGHTNPTSEDGGQQSMGRQATQAKEFIKQAAHETKEQLAARAKDVGHTAKEQAAAASEQLKRQGSALFHEQRSRIAREIMKAGGAVRFAAGRLHEEQNENVAGYADAIANQIESTARYVEDRDVNQVIQDLENFTRRRPEIVFGGMFVAGLAAARFIRAQRPSDPNMNPMNSEMYRSQFGVNMDNDESSMAATGQYGSTTYGEESVRYDSQSVNRRINSVGRRTNNEALAEPYERTDLSVSGECGCEGDEGMPSRPSQSARPEARL